MLTASPWSSIGFGEFLEYSSETLVILGALGEALGEFTNFLGVRCNAARKDRVLRISTVVLLIGLAGALGTTIRTNVLAGEAIDDLNMKARRASNDSNSAVQESKTAVGFASAAQKTARIAESESQHAEGIVSDAEGLARSARREADSFQREIAKAQADAANAEAHLAEALRKADAAAQQAERIIARLSDRELTDDQIKAIGDSLARFAGQEYDVTTYWDVRECLKISNRLYAALERAKWRYIPPAATGSFLLGGTVGVQVYRHPEAESVTVGAADALVMQLNRNGIDAQLKLQNPKNNPKHNRISLTVGTKPQ